MPVRLLLALLILATAASGCGRRGALEAPSPPEATIITGQPVPADVAGQADPAAPGSDALNDLEGPGAGVNREQESPGSQEPAETVPAGAPKSGFFLDPLI